MEDVTNNEEEVIVEESTPDLEGVSVVSNGKEVDVTDTDPKEEEETEEGSEGDDRPATETDLTQEDIDTQKKADEDVKKLLTDKKVDFEGLLATYNEAGSLSDDQYKQLEEAGFPKTVVDAYIAGAEAKSNQFATAVMNHVGGSETYTKLTAFVQGQGEEAVNAYNKMIETADLSTIKMYLSGVKAQMDAKYGTSNPTVMGKVNVAKAGGYTDQGEMIKAMSDKRYGRDAKYTKAVEARVLVSNFIK